MYMFKFKKIIPFKSEFDVNKQPSHLRIFFLERRKDKGARRLAVYV